MFNKLKQFKDLRSQAKQMQKQMEQETLEKSKDGVRIKINGSNEILEMDIVDDLMSDKEKLIRIIKELFKDAVKSMQKKMALKMMKGGKIDFDALKKMGM
ncbi:MAG: YbaB/EbfC family nucleoid-associated protein [Candidatus Jacksonbacteria bacterium]